MTMRVDDLITLLRTYPPELLVYMDTKSDWQHIDIHCAYLDEDGHVRLSARDPNEDEEE
jgi:hypothetical protein